MSTKIRVVFCFVVSSPLLNVVRRNSAAVFLSSSVLAQRRPGSTCRGAQHARRALTTSPLRRPLLDIAQSARSISQGQTTEIGLFFLPSREYNKALPRFLTELSRSEAPQSTTFLIVSWRKFFFWKVYIISFCDLNSACPIQPKHPLLDLTHPWHQLPLSTNKTDWQQIDQE